MERKYMYRILISTIFTVIGLFEYTQAQSLDNLEDKHGFQDVKLDLEITDYPDFQLRKRKKIKESEEPIYIYSPPGGTYQKIGEASIHNMEIEVFLGKITKISLVTDKDPDIMKALKTLYGEPTFSIRTNAWEWRSPSVILSLKSISKRKIEIIYNSRKLNQYIEDNKKKGIKELSDDF